MANDLVHRFRLEVVMKSILLAITGIVFSGALWAGEAIEESMSAEGVSSVNIENVRGKVTVVGTQENQITVNGKLGEYAERFEFKKSGNVLRIKVVVDERRGYQGSNDKGSVFTVNMPKTLDLNFDGISTDVNISQLSSHVEVKTVSGDISVNNLDDNIELTTVSGDIESNNLQGKIRLSSVSGNIDDKHSSGRLRLKSVSGTVETRSTAKEVTLGAVSGDVDFVLDEVEELVVTSVSGDIEGSLTLMDNGQLKVSGVSSDIELEFQGDLNADFRLQASAGGDIVNRITDDKAKHAKYGPSSKLQFSTGNGSASVRGNVVSGEIKVKSR